MATQAVLANDATQNDCRLLNRINLQFGLTRKGDIDGATTSAAVVDVETTGLDQDSDKVIELAIRRFRYDDQGHIVEIGKSWMWREDPGFPLPAEITRLTGITDSDLAGKRIDEDLATSILSEVDLVIAHHANFDRPMLEKRLTNLPGLPWACSCSQIDWAGAGFEGRSLGYLTMQAGWFFDAHRAQGDVDAVIQLLQHEDTDGVPLLYELNENALADSHLIDAVGANFAVKDALRLRGYRWNPADRHWSREVTDADLLPEQAWLAREVYAHAKRPANGGPRITRRTAFERFR